MKLDLLTNATVVNDAIRFVAERIKLSSSSKDDKISKKPAAEQDYNHENEELEVEQEKDTAKTEDRTTTNQVFY
jgi:hypothetical protein